MIHVMSLKTQNIYKLNIEYLAPFMQVIQKITTQCLFSYYWELISIQGFVLCELLIWQSSFPYFSHTILYKFLFLIQGSTSYPYPGNMYRVVN